MFSHLRDAEANKVDAPVPVDLNAECCAMMEKLMLAQAQVSGRMGAACSLHGGGLHGVSCMGFAWGCVLQLQLHAARFTRCACACTCGEVCLTCVAPPQAGVRLSQGRDGQEEPQRDRQAGQAGGHHVWGGLCALQLTGAPCGLVWAGLGWAGLGLMLGVRLKGGGRERERES